MKKIVVILLSFFLLCGCTAQNAPKNSKLNIVTTIFPIYDFVRAVAGDNVNCHLLIDPGTEVHSFDPAPSDVKAVYNADLVIYIGGHSDEWVNTLLADVNVNSLPLIDCIEELCTEHHDHNHNHDASHTHGADEHIWTSPTNAVLMIEEICQYLCVIDEKNAEDYRKNCEAYKNKIKAVDEEIRNTVRNQENPFILVADRFPFLYFTENYGIKYEAAFGGCANSTDISLKTMSRLVKSVNANKVSYVYCTEMSAKNIANVLSEETGVKILELHSAHNVTLKDFENGITYVEIMRNNLKALKEGWK